MKFLLPLCLCCMCYRSFSQVAIPAGVANTYTLGEKEGYSGRYYSFIAPTGTGITYLADSYNNFYIVGNNYDIVFDTIKKLQTIIYAIKAIDNNEAWVICAKRIVVFKNRQLDRIITLPYEVEQAKIDIFKDRIFLYKKYDDNSAILAFDGVAVKAVPPSALLQPSSFKHINWGLDKRTLNAEYTQIGIDTAYQFIPKMDVLSTDLILEKSRIGNHVVALTINKPFFCFPYIKKFPRIYNNDNAGNVYAIAEDADGAVYAGSYQNILSIIKNNSSKQVKDISVRYMNGGVNNYFNKHLYFIGEKVEAKPKASSKIGVVQIDSKGNIQQVASDGNTGFYTYITRDSSTFYFAAYNNQSGLWQTSTKSLETLYPKWHKIDSTNGCYEKRIFTITEDTLGRIWCGNPRRTFTIYNPKTDSAKTWSVENKEAKFGPYASLTDYNGTIWIGTTAMGLWYYNDYKKPAHPKSFRKISHPLLDDSKTIFSLARYKQWLLIGNADKLLLLNIDSFFQKRKTIIRYLNPQEAAFTTTLEQNTMLLAKKDSTVWFSTSDMLYQWDIKTWLQLPTYHVTLEPILSTKDSLFCLSNTATNYFEPGVNSFNIHLRYTSADNLARYLSVILVKDDDSLQWPKPDVNSQFSFQNLETGSYTLWVAIYEMDGSIVYQQYHLQLDKHLWQKWWVWLIATVFIMAGIVYNANEKRKRLLAEQNATIKALELQNFKDEQEKKLTELRLVSLSNQFRPHFILNALNAIGAKMHTPSEESIISRLGESVNLIFNHVKANQATHAFSNEWQLTTNLIDIHRLMYLKEMAVSLPDKTELKQLQHLQIPLGLLQIPVENALLHGLSNKTMPPWLLGINITETDTYFKIQIIDNGVGRARAATLTNYTKHGTGTKNLQEILDILNQNMDKPITVDYYDNLYNNEHGYFGTSVTITIPKNYQYDT